MKPIEFEVFERRAAPQGPPSRSANATDVEGPQGNPGVSNSDNGESCAGPEVVRVETIPLEKPFFNNNATPGFVLRKESPSHRVICFLKAQGKTHREIAEMLGITPQTVYYTINQPWARQMIAEEIGKAGRSEVEVLLKGEVAESVRKLIAVRDSVEASPDVQRKAANDILDRFYGKPNQRIISTTVDPNQLSDSELAQIVKQGAN